MTIVQRLQRLLPAAAFLILPACASVPKDFEQMPGNSWSKPAETSLGKFFSRGAPGGEELSGLFLLDKPRTALRARLGLASLAEQTLDLQYYLWKGDTTGGLLLHRALQAADRGVRVRILMDDIFHKGRDAVYAAIDAHPMVQVRVFNPIGNRRVGRNLNFVFNKRKLNNRMHNKIFLVDGAAVIMGGRNIGDDYFGLDPKLNFRDLEVLAVGPAALEAGEAFDTYWNSRFAVPIDVLRKMPAGEADLDGLRQRMEQRLENAGALPYTVPVTFADAEEGLASLRSQLTWAEAEIVVDPLERFDGGNESPFVKFAGKLTTHAERDLVLQSAYLIPTKEGIQNIASLTDRGVRVRLLTNSLMSNNHISVHAHYAKYRKRLLRAGGELYELRADAALREFLESDKLESGNAHAGLHTKAAVVDGHTTLIGSFNIDPRSRELNSEIGLLIRSEVFAARVLEAMDVDFDPSNSYRVTLDDNDKIRWTGAPVSGTGEFKKEPGAGLGKRMLSTLIRLIPMESEL
jgi:putative cardiolipin synthase